ncbi:MAG: AAA family ATPase, partial [Myxococcales bacterium]|nr:AAA family ATPase [Myxococcales bacterium]
LDRFFFKVMVPFPTLDELVTVMARTTGTTHDEVSPVLTIEDLGRMRRTVREVTIAPEILRYALRIVLATQPDGRAACPTAKKFLKYGASPRGAQTLVLGAKVQALLAGRPYVAISDLRAVAHSALRHRLGRSFEAEAEGLTPDMLVDRILSEVPEAEGPAAREMRA